MTDARAAPARPTPQRPRALVESALATAIDRVGPVLFFDPDRLRSLLRQVTTEAPVEIEMVIAALGEEVPQHLLASNGDDEVAALLPRLVQRVMKNRKVERGPAAWAVRTWAHALALPTTGLDAAATSAPIAAPKAVDVAAIVQPRAEVPNRRPPVPVPMPAVVPDGSPIPTPPTRPDAARVAAPPRPPTAPIAGPVPAPMTQRASDVAEALSDFVPLDDVQPIDHLETIVAPVPEIVPGFLGGEAHWMMASALDARVDSDANEEPPAPRPEPAFAPIAPARYESFPPETAAPGPMRPRNLAIAGVVLLAIVAAVAYGWWSLVSPPVAPIAKGTVAVPPPAASVASDVPTAPTTIPSTSVPSTNDAAPAPTVAPSTPPDASVPTAPRAALPAPVEASTTAVASPTASAASARAPTITRIDPPTIVVGKPFSIALAVDGDPRRVASIERRVVDSDATWSSDTATHATRALARTKSGGFMVPFRPLDRVSTSTLEFTAVDRDGARGPARRIVVKVVGEAGAAAPAASASASTGTIAATPAAADGECTPSSCGSVVSSREVELRNGATNFENIVRMDDRSIQNTTQPTRWALGTRVRASGGRYVAIDQ